MTSVQFLITGQFKSLVDTLNDGNNQQKVVLIGPKGVGKSITLWALAALWTKPHIVYSLQGSDFAFYSYMNEVCKKYQGEGESIEQAWKNGDFLYFNW